MYDLIFQLIYLSCMAVFVATVFWGTLRLLDKALKITFSEVFQDIKDEPIAAAIYFVGRIIAVAILYSPLLRVLL